MSNAVLVTTLVQDKQDALKSFREFCKVDRDALSKNFSSIAHQTRSFKRYKRSRTASVSHKKGKGDSRHAKRRRLDVTDDRLRSHVWSARRMHMDVISGIKVPRCSHRRGAKASLRLYKKEKTLLHDSSYLSVISLFGAAEVMYQALSRVMDAKSDAFVTLTSPALFRLKTPVVEHTALIHELDQFPLGLIGPCKITVCATEDGSIQCWLWVHPILTDRVQALFVDCTDITMRQLQGVDRIELYGSNAGEVLQSLTLSADTSASTVSKFLDHIRTHRTTLNNVWRDGYVLPVTWSDPRLSTSPSSTTENASGCWPATRPLLLQSELWSPSTKPIPTDFVLNQRKHVQRTRNLQGLLQLLSSTAPRNAATNKTPNYSGEQSTIPALIIRHGLRTTNASDVSQRHLPGWSLLVPAGWTRVLWMHCIRQGAIAVGTDDVAAVQMSEDMLTFPRDYLDCSAGREHWTQTLQAEEDVERRKPTNKQRIGHRQHIQRFLGEDAADAVAVVRRAEYLQHFTVPKVTTASLFGEGVSREDLVKRCVAHSEWVCADTYYSRQSSLPPLPTLTQRTYLHGRLSVTGRGVPRVGALILRVTARDLQCFVLHCLEQAKQRWRRSETRVDVDDKTLQFQQRKKGKREQGDVLEEELRVGEAWKGVELTTDELRLITRDETTESSSIESADHMVMAGRVVLGVVTSGSMHRTVDSGAGVTAVSLCRADLWYDALTSQWSRLLHHDSHRLVLFRNPGSRWLRPAYLDKL